MFLRIDSRPVRTQRRWGRCRCGDDGYVERCTRSVRIVRAERRVAGPRQVSVAPLVSWRTCCVAKASVQQQLWAEARERLDRLETEDLVSPEQTRELIWQLGELMSRDLGPEVSADAVPHGVRVHTRRIVEEGSRVRSRAAPDLTRLSVAPPRTTERIGQLVEASFRLRPLAEGRVSAEELLYLKEAPGLEELAGPYALQVRTALESSLAQVGELARAALQQLREELQLVRSGIEDVQEARAVVAAAEEVESAVAIYRSGLPWRERTVRSGFQAVSRAELKPLERPVRHWIRQLQPHRLLILARALRPGTQVEIGRAVFGRRRSAAGAQSAVSRVLRAFSRQLESRLKKAKR